MSIIILCLQKERLRHRAENADCLGLQKEVILKFEVFVAFGMRTCIQPLENILFCRGKKPITLRMTDGGVNVQQSHLHILTNPFPFFFFKDEPF